MLFKSLFSVLLATAAFVPHAFAQTGLTYEFTTKSEVADDQTVTSGGRIKSQADKMRMEMVAMMDQNVDNNQATILVLDNGNRVIMLMPQKKSYFELPSFDAIGNMAASMIKTEASNVKMDVKKIGAGPTLLGYATVHYRVTHSMDVTRSTMGSTQKSREEATMDMYLAPALKDAVSSTMGRMQWGTMAANAYGKEYADKQRAVDAQFAADGLPLKITGVTKSTTDGETESNTITYELTKIVKGNIPASEFEIPAGYSKAELPKMPNLENLDVKKALGDALSGAKGEAAAQTESVGDAAKAGVKEGAAETKKEATDATKEAAKAKTKKAIRGLFGKP